jgi:hypothetical protein
LIDERVVAVRYKVIYKKGLRWLFAGIWPIFLGYFRLSGGELSFQVVCAVDRSITTGWELFCVIRDEGNAVVLVMDGRVDNRASK